MSIYKKEKLAKLFETKDLHDCSFLVDGENVKAHKLLLALASPVFESMLYGDMSAEEIIIEDIDSEVFKKSLQYIYTDSVKIDSVLDAWNLVYVSQKYFLYELQSVCVDFIKANLSVSNLLMSYEHSRLYNLNFLIEKCLEDILMFTRGVLLYSNYHMQVDTLNGILKEDCGNSTDLALLAVSWALEECAIQDIASTKDNIYKVFKKYGVFSELNLKNFAFLYKKGMFKPLTKDQIYVFENIVDLTQQLHSDLISFSPRIYCGKKSSLRNQFLYRTEYKNSVSLRFRHNELLSPTVICNKNCLLFGVAVATKSQPVHASGSDYIGGANVYIYVKHTNNLSHLLYEHISPNVYLEYNESQNITFPVPILFEAYKQYMICVEYVTESNVGESVLLKFMSDKLYKSKSNSTVIQFIDEGNGSVLKGLCFYEV